MTRISEKNAPPPALISCELLREGDHATWSHFYAMYQKPLERFIARHLKETSDAPDVLQEVFFKAFRSLSSVRESASLKPWIFQIALNASRDHLSEQLSNPVRLCSEDEWQLLSDQTESLYESSDPFDEYYLKELEQLVFLHIQSLPDDLKEVFLYREGLDLEYEEIAQLTNVPLGTVRSRLSRARGQVLNALVNR